LRVLQIQIEEEEKKLKAAIEEAEKQYSEVRSEMEDLEIKSKQFEELEERLVCFLLAIVVSGISCYSCAVYHLYHFYALGVTRRYYHRITVYVQHYTKY
jgi:hypothetical protein